LVRTKQKLKYLKQRAKWKMKMLKSSDDTQSTTIDVLSVSVTDLPTED
jgi:hypothetical protein